MKVKMLPSVLMFILSLLILGCSQSQESPDVKVAGEKPLGQPGYTGVTQPFVFTPEQLLGVDPRGQMVAWNARSAPGVTNARVYLRNNNGPKQLFAQGLEGKQGASWLNPGHRYVLELSGWTGTADGPLLARVTIDENGNVSREKLR